MIYMAYSTHIYHKHEKYMVYNHGPAMSILSQSSQFKRPETKQQMSAVEKY